MLKRRAAAVGIDGLFAGHSLRSGFATEGYAQGTPELAIMRHGRWKSPTVMRGYVEEGTMDQQRCCTVRPLTRQQKTSGEVIIGRLKIRALPYGFSTEPRNSAYVAVIVAPGRDGGPTPASAH